MLRTDLWVAAFVRRHNDIGHICVIARRGDPIAGQIFIEIDHLNGRISLLSPAPATAHVGDDADRPFVERYHHVDRTTVAEQMSRELNFDPDLWVVALEMRGDDAGVTMVRL